SLASSASVFLPTATPYESNGMFVNRAGRAQAFAPARVPGRSVNELIHDETFPRTPRLAPPDAAARPAWWALELLREYSVRKLAGPPVAWISSADAERLRANGSIRVEVEGQAAELAVRAVGTVPAGVLLVPRDVHWASPPAQGAPARVAAPAAAEVEACWR